MADNKQKSKEAQEREARLAEALRQNLRRRKTQAKGRVTEDETSSDSGQN